MKKYNTRQRESILEFFRRYPDRCFSAKELTSHCTDIGLTTVYRTVAMLESEGKIRRFNINGLDVFRLVNDGECYHMHLVCKSCGDTLHSGCHFIGEIERHLDSEHNFMLDKSRTVIYGLCGKCREGGVK